ncbi:hypothetical protein MPSEU_000306400 [Mayamaea pseudoterrestris]|nr:hypothetical protein MPSEU_000306400 [Mayamaea pseudoterrestris]
MPPRAVTFPLGNAHRDACLRCMHLGPKPHRLLVQRIYGLLFKKLTKNAPPPESDDSNKEPLALGCAFLLLVVWKSFEEQERVRLEQEEEAPENDAMNNDIHAAPYTASTDPYFLLRQVTTDYARLVRLLAGGQQQQHPYPSLLVAAKAILSQYLETCEKIPKWMQIAASKVTADAFLNETAAATSVDKKTSVDPPTAADEDDDEEEDDEDMDNDDENDNAQTEKKQNKRQLVANATGPLLQFLRSVLQGLVENTTILMSSYCLDFGPLWDRTACNSLEPTVWTRYMQQLVTHDADHDNETSTPSSRDEPYVIMLGEHAIQNDAQVMMQLQTVAWKMACYRAHVLHSQNTASGLPSRHERLLASCGSLSFVLALNRIMMDHIMAESDGDEDRMSKKFRKDKLLETIRDAVTDSRNFSRWTPEGSDDNKIGSELKADELQEEVTALATAVYAVVAQEAPLKPKSDDSQPNSPTNDDSRIQQLLELMPDGVDPHKVVFYLPSTADLLYNSTLENLKLKEFHPKDIAYMNEADLAEMNALDAIVVGAHEFRKIEPQDKGLIVSPGGSTARRVVTPPVLTSNMELNEWTVSLLYLETVKPSKLLMDFLNLANSFTTNEKKCFSVVFPILNRILLRLSQENMLEKTSRVSPINVNSSTGVVEVAGEASPDKQLCTAVVAFYYHALEAILYSETIRLPNFSHQRLVFDPGFHKSLLACCIMCVVKAVGVTQKIRPSGNIQSLQIFGVLPIAEISAYDFLKISESFVRALTSSSARGKIGSPLVFALPKILVKDIKRTESVIMDSLLWVRDKKSPESMIDMIEDFQEKTDKGSSCLWPPQVLMPAAHEPPEFDCIDLPERRYPSSEHEDYADYRCVSYLLRRLLKVAKDRIQALCSFLGIPHHLPVAHQVWVAFRYILRNHVDLLYDRHLDHLILCCLYGVCRALKYDPDLTFARIIDAYVVIRGPDLGDVTCQRIVRHIKIMDAAPQPIADIIYLYNHVFLWKVHQHLLRSKSIQVASEEIANVSRTRHIQVNSKSLDSHLKDTQDALRGRSEKQITQAVIQMGTPVPGELSLIGKAGGDSTTTLP